MEISRRDFVKLIGGISGSIALGGCAMEEALEIPDRLLRRIRTGPGLETWKNTVCGLCPGGCGMSVRMIDTVPVGIKGNGQYPVNQGGMCPLGLNALHLLYHPDRLKGPVRRVGEPGSGKWEAISWDEALKTIADRLTELRNSGRSREVAILGNTERGVMEEYLRRFMNSYGSPNYFHFSTGQNDSVSSTLVHGRPDIPSFDLLGAGLVLSFGANFLEGGWSPVYYTKLYSRHREQQTRYIQVESRMSMTASNAERWIPVRPGTYGALALGVAYVLIREDLLNDRFLRNDTFGFEDWVDNDGTKHIGFRNIVLANYYPEKVSEITGVTASTILELGRLVGSTPRTVVIGGPGSGDNTNGTFSQMAVQSLNALLGNYETGGGVFFHGKAPLDRFPDLDLDAAAKEGNRAEPIGGPGKDSYPLTGFSIDRFAKNVIAGEPYPLSVLFLYGGNPLFQALNHQDLSAALKKIPLVVSFDSIINETSEYASIVLPEHTFLEDWGEVSDVPTVGFSHLGIRQPVVEPLHDTRNAGDVFLDLARRIGGTVGSSAAFADYLGGLKLAVGGLYRSGEGAEVTRGQKTRWLEYLQQRGWQSGRYASFDEFWDQLLTHGGWWNPVRSDGKAGKKFRTPSGKYEFYSRKLMNELNARAVEGADPKSHGNLEALLSRLDISARGDNVALPHHEPVPYEGDRPLYLVTFQVLPNRDGVGAALPMMQEMFGYAVHTHWESWVEIHPETAAAAGISSGDWTWVESSVGSVRVKARVTPGIMPDVVAIPFGMGHTSYGRYARGYGVNPNTILRDLYDRVSGKPATGATKIKISRAV